MKRRTVIVSPEANEDLLSLYDWIAEAAGSQTAASYLERLRAYCGDLDVASERGRRRDDIRADLRIVGFEGRATIAFAVSRDSVTILRVFHRGRDWEALLP